MLQIFGLLIQNFELNSKHFSLIASSVEYELVFIKSFVTLYSFKWY